MKLVTLSGENDRQSFATDAANHFKANPDHRTYARGNITPGEWFAVLWGLGDDCVMVFKIADDTEVTVYQQIVDKFAL